MGVVRLEWAESEEGEKSKNKVGGVRARWAESEEGGWSQT